MKKIYYVRHGETHANANRIMSGGEHHTLLNEKGEKQAIQAGKDLIGKGIEVIVCSSQQRALQTAKLIAQQIGYPEEKIVTQQLFVEQMMGPYSGKPYEVHANDKESNTLKPGIESMDDFRQRVKKAIDNLKQLNETIVLVVAHGGTGRMVKVVNQNLPHSNFHLMDRIGNGGIYEFELE